MAAVVTLPPSTLKGEDLPDRFAFVDDLDSLEVALEALAEAKSLALDAEGTCLSRYGALCTLQIGIPHGLGVLEEVYILDVCTLGDQAFDHSSEGATLRGILEDPAVVKYMFDCRMDTDALFHQFKVTLAGVVDLQISEVALRRQEGQPAPRVIGLRGALDKYLPPEVLRELQPYRTATMGIKQAFSTDPRCWEIRPLSSGQVIYAAMDVAYMHRLAEKLHSGLTPELKEVVDAESTKRALFFNETDEKALYDGTEKAVAPQF